MNISEATATQTLLDWLTSLTLHEVHPACQVDGASLTDAVDILATRAHRALGAGPTAAQVRAQMRTVLAAPGPCEYPGDLEHDHRACEDVPPNAGSTS